MQTKAHTKQPRGLTGTAIKLIALALMLLDHLHYFFGFTGVIPLWFSWLGRISGWLFLFAVVEGFVHTHNRKKYFLRIWLMGAAMGAVNYLIAILIPRPDGFFPMNNIFATLVVLMVLWQGFDWLRAKKIALGLCALVLPFVLLALFQNLPGRIMGYAYMLVTTVLPLPLLTEGGILYLLGGLPLYLLHRHRGWQAGVFVVAVLAWNLYIGLANGLPLGPQWLSYHYEWMGIFAAPFMLLYNGQRGRNIKTLFYVFYPAHVYILYAASFLLYLVLN